MNTLFSPMLAKNMTEQNISDYKSALEQLSNSLKNKEIYNTDYQNLNRTLGRLVGNHFSDLVRQYFWYTVNNEPRRVVFTGEGEELHYKSIMSFYDIISAKKKADNIKVFLNERDQAYIEYYKALCNELIETAVALKELKTYIIKGRKPSTKPVIINENKIVKLCPCCFREIAINKEGKIVHHGYTREYGFNSAPCFGQGYDHYEKSDKGTRDYIKVLNDVKNVTLDALNELPNKETLSTNIKNKFVLISKDDVRFEKLYKHTENELRSKVRGCLNYIDFLTTKLK